MRKPWRFRLPDNLNLMAAAFAIGFVTWVFAKSADMQDGRLVVPIRAEMNDPRIEVEVVPTEMPVFLRFPREVEPYISSDNFSLLVDATELRNRISSNWQSITKTMSRSDMIANIPQARRVDVVKIGTKDSTVQVRMRWRAVAALVKPELTGTDRVPSGYQLVTPVRVNPKEVFLVGDNAILSSLPKDPETSRIVVGTEPITVSGRTNSGLETVPLKLPEGIQAVDRPSQMVEVAIEVQPVQTVREIKGIPLEFEAVSPESVSMSYSPRTATVTVYGPQNLLKDLNVNSIDVALVRPSEEIPGTTRELRITATFDESVPDEIRQKLIIRSIDPPSLSVRYTARNSN